jgi:hypothetical protein
MPSLVAASLLLNIVVLIPVSLGLIRSAGWTRAAFGEFTPARGILLSIYLAILMASLLLLVRPEPQRVATLLALQIAYKLTTPLTVGTLRNPVVLSNLGIAAFHLVTLGRLLTSRPSP